MPENQEYIVGMKELQEQIEQLIKSVDDDKVAPILQDAAEVVAEQARANAPRGPTGRLKRAVITKLYKKHPPVAIAAVNFNIAPHMYLVERGSRGERIGGARTKRPGKSTGVMPASHFFRNAWNSKKLWVKQELVRRLAENIKQAVQ